MPCLLFFSVISLNMPMFKSIFYLLRTAQPDLVFHGCDLARLPSWRRKMNASWLGSTQSEISLQMEFIIFQGCLSKQVPIYLGSLLHIIKSLFSYFCLFQNAVLHTMFKLGFWNFESIFLIKESSLVATFFLSF